MQLSPEDQQRVFGKDKLKTAYQKKKRSLNLNRRVTRDYLTIMSEEKDDLKSIKVYKFDNTKEKWHEFALKFRVIADTRDYWGIIDGSVVPPDKLAVITITAEDTGEALKEKKENLKARKANKIGYRDLVTSTEGISFTIVENAVSEELPSGDLKKAWERLERRWNPKTREDKVEVYTKFLNYKLENTRQRPMDWIAFLEKKRSELKNTGHIMSDETFITHLLNSLPQTVYEGAILVIKDKLRKSILEITEIEQILEDKFQAMKQAKGWEEEEDDYALFVSPSSKKGPRKPSKDVVAAVENLDTKQLIVPTRKVIKTRARNRKTSKRKNRGVKGTQKAKDILICQKLSAIIAENLDILQGTARKHAIMLILLKKMSKMASRNPCWYWTILVYVRSVRWSVQNHNTKMRAKMK